MLPSYKRNSCYLNIPSFLKLRRVVEDLNRSIRLLFVCDHFRSFKVKILLKE